MNNNAKEVLVGGLMGLIAVIAIFLKLSLADFSSSAVLDSLIELSSIGVSLAIFYAFISSKTPSIKFEKRMQDSFDEWVKSTNGLICKVENVKAKKPESDFVRCYMIVDYRKYFYGSTGNSVDEGEFIHLPTFVSDNYVNGVTITFYLNKSIMLNVLRANDAHTANDDKAKLIVNEYANGIYKKFTKMYSNVEEVNPPTHINDLKYKTSVRINGNFTKQSQIDELFQMINYLMLLYAYAS